MPKAKSNKKSPSTPYSPKPTAGKKIESISAEDINVPGLSKDFLKATARSWTNPKALVDAISTANITQTTAAQALSHIRDSFKSIGSSQTVSSQLSNYAKSCEVYSRKPKFEQDFLSLYIAREGRVKDRLLHQHSVQLSGQAINNASTITSRALDLVRDSTMEELNGGNAEASSSVVNGSVEEDDEESLDGLMAPVRQVNFVANQPKLPIISLESIQKKCIVAISSAPGHSIPISFRELLQNYQAHQRGWDSLNKYSHMLGALRSLMDENLEYKDLPRTLWCVDKTGWAEKDENFFNIISLAVTDFWGLFARKDFNKSHERFFWVDYVNPIFKHFPINNEDVVLSWCESMMVSNNNSQIVPGVWNNSTEKLFADGVFRKDGFEVVIMESSGPFGEEYVEHSMGDTWKLMKMSANSLRDEILKYQDASFQTIKGLSVFSVQCICDKITLMRTSLHDANKWEFVEMRSATIPVKWEARANLMLVFELLATLQEGYLEQKRVLSQIRREVNNLDPVDDKDTVRYHFSNSDLLENDN